jgi:uncharacterized protein (DUF1330 family)
VELPQDKEMHIHPTREAGRALLKSGLDGPITMLNLLRFRKIADYGESPELAPTNEISGADAYRRYIEAVTSLIDAAGGELTFRGRGGAALIGPADERWDLVLLVRYPSVGAFMTFATSADYLAIAGHRTAALEDSRLIPLT